MAKKGHKPSYQLALLKDGKIIDRSFAWSNMSEGTHHGMRWANQLLTRMYFKSRIN